jgi:hypothetical protein
MKTVMSIITVFLAIFLVSACASMKKPFETDEKYNLDGQLEVVDEIHKYTMRDWDKIDSQSFTLQTGAGTYYLIILRRPSTDIMFTERISIKTSSQMVRPGFNSVTVHSSSRSEDYTIHKIYKLDGAQHAREIKAQLTGK